MPPWESLHPHLRERSLSIGAYRVRQELSVDSYAAEGRADPSWESGWILTEEVWVRSEDIASRRRNCPSLEEAMNEADLWAAHHRRYLGAGA